MQRHTPMSVRRTFAVTAMIAASVVWTSSALAYHGNQYQYQPHPDESDLDTHGHYTNHDGNIVHSPAHTRSGSVPAGATAQCRDGSYSFSQHHSGTCSRHGGVASWQ